MCPKERPSHVLPHMVSDQTARSGTLQQVQDRITTWTKPAGETVVISVVSDLMRSKAELVLGNALLRQQLTVLGRQVKRPRFTGTDCGLMVLLASKLATWRQRYSLCHQTGHCAGIASCSSASGHTNPNVKAAIMRCQPRSSHLSNAWQ